MLSLMYGVNEIISLRQSIVEEKLPKNKICPINEIEVKSSVKKDISPSVDKPITDKKLNNNYDEFSLDDQNVNIHAGST